MKLTGQVSNHTRIFVTIITKTSISYINLMTMDGKVIVADGFSYKISDSRAMEEAGEGEYVLCLEEVRDNALPENKNRQVSVYYQWAVGNNCNGCRKILETTNPKLIKKGVRKLAMPE